MYQRKRSFYPDLTQDQVRVKAQNNVQKLLGVKLYMSDLVTYTYSRMNKQACRKSKDLHSHRERMLGLAFLCAA